MPPSTTELVALRDGFHLLTPSERKEGMAACRAVGTGDAEASLHSFMQQAWPIIEPTTEFVDGKHIQAICQHLEAVSKGQIRNLIINIPPRCCKSLAVSVFWFCWSWIHKPSSRWLYSSYAGTLSSRDSVKCRDVLCSQWYQNRWGKLITLKDDQNVKNRFENTATGLRLATSVGAVATGEGGDFLICDDALSSDESRSDLKRKAANDWWDTTMSTRGNDPKTVARVVIMQRLHEDDLTGHILEQAADEWETLILPMDYDETRHCVTSLGWEDWRKSPSEPDLLWPERFGRIEVDRLRRSLGAYAASGQLGQQPSPSTDGMFSRSDFRYFKMKAATGEDIKEKQESSEPEDADVDAIFGEATEGETIYELSNGTETRRFFHSDCWWYQTADTAMKTGQANDYTAVGTYIITPENDILILDMFREKIPVPKQFDMLIAQRARYPWMRDQYIEDTASGIGLVQQGAMAGMPFKAIKVTKDKVTRAVPLATFIENHKVFHLTGAPWLVDYEAELLTFPVGSHDDQVDSAAHAAMILASKSRAGWVIDPETDEKPSEPAISADGEWDL